MELDGTSAIVTGGASGLGKATARALIEGGASVVLVDLPGPRGEEAAAELGDRAGFVGADVADEAQGQAAVARGTAPAPPRAAGGAVIPWFNTGWTNLPLDGLMHAVVIVGAGLLGSMRP